MPFHDNRYNSKNYKTQEIADKNNNTSFYKIATFTKASIKIENCRSQWNQPGGRDKDARFLRVSLVLDGVWDERREEASSVPDL